MFLDDLERNIAALPGKTALAFIDGPRLTYGELGEAVCRCVNYLRAQGIQAGDRVAAQLPKSPAFIILHLASMRMGAVFLPLNPAYPKSELRYFLADSGARLLIADASAQDALADVAAELDTLETTRFIDAESGFLASLRRFPAAPAIPAPREKHQTAMMLYTSGTTSRPKGAQITHGNLTANIRALHQAWGWRQDDTLLHALPIFHVHGLVVALHGALHAGASACLTRTFDAAKTLELLRSGDFSVFMAVPTMHRRIYQRAGSETVDLSGLRLMTSGSDRLPDDLFHGYQRKFNVTLLERYGMTETGMNLSNPLRGERRVGTVGKPLPGVQARVAEPGSDRPRPDGAVGELQIKGEHVFKGYWRQPQKTADAFSADGWLRTGDLALRGADGIYTLKGRAKDLIISGGLNIYPPEVELVLMAHPAVAACAVIGCPDDEWGEQVLALIVPQPHHSIDADEILGYCRQNLAAYKAPRRLRILPRLPQNALGKVQKAKLRQDFCS